MTSASATVTPEPRVDNVFGDWCGHHVHGQQVVKATLTSVSCEIKELLPRNWKA